MILRESEIRQKWRNPLKNECSLSLCQEHWGKLIVYGSGCIKILNQKFGGILPLKLSQLPHLVVCGVSETNLYQKSGTEDTDNVGGIMGFL